MLTVGTVAPDFTLPSHRGGEVHLADLHGTHRALLVFYPKDDTPGCTAQLCAIRDNFSVLTGDDVIPFGINADDATAHAAFADEQDYPFDLLVDEDLTVARRYEAALDGAATPQRTVYIVGKDGRVLFAERGAPSPADMLAVVRSASDAPTTA